MSPGAHTAFVVAATQSRERGESVAGRTQILAPLAADLGYLKPDELGIVEDAFELAHYAHEGQARTSGEAYITHPVAVARILAAWHLDHQTIAAAVLHDVAEDTPITIADIEAKFGHAVASLVDGVSKLDKIEFASREAHAAASFRKMLLAVSRDVRVMLIKLADRLHNMRTLGAVSAEKAARVARETQELYSPIAYRLGLSQVYYELEDICLKALHPQRYAVLEKALKKARGNRRELVTDIVASVQNKLAEFGLENTITGREKHISSIHRKMQKEDLAFAEVLDIYAFRIIVKELKDCYAGLGAVHAIYQPIPGKFQDYIAIPKSNGYQSLHTKVYGPFGMAIEFQIRTQEMHRVAESGIAAHWLYKLTGEELADIQTKTHQWLHSILDLQGEGDDPVQFLEHVKVDLFPEEVYVFSPHGKVFTLPRGATAIDFAYSVHTDVGHRAVAARVNGSEVALSTALRNGDRVEVVTRDDAQPSPAWLSFAASAKARTRIRHHLKTVQHSDAADLGELMLVQAIRGLGANPNDINDEDWRAYMKGETAKSRNDVFADIGLGKRLAVVVARILLARHEKQLPADGPKRPDALTISGTEGMALQFSSCCKPIPGDPILGQIRNGQGLFIHTHDCPAIQPFHYDPEKWIDVNWDMSDLTGRLFDVDIRLTAANQRGVLAKLAAEISEALANIEHFEVEEKATQAYTTLVFTLQVRDRGHLAQVLKQLRRIPEVVRIARVKTGVARTKQRAS
jgi:GTP diphosphokinase / guanosine-3',5'-bis(diphosphate) 3'-diphosphatase